MKTQRSPLLATFAIALATVAQADATPFRNRPELRPPPADGSAVVQGW